jgi:hypothetical protein
MFFRWKIACASSLCCRLVLRNHLADNGHQFDGDLYDCLSFALEGRFILGSSLFVSLLFIVGENSTHAFLVPPWWKMFGFYVCFSSSPTLIVTMSQQFQKLVHAEAGAANQGAKRADR